MTPSAMESFYTTLQAMQGVVKLSQHAKDHDDAVAHMASLFGVFVDTLGDIYCALEEERKQA